jgi:hypothetical protein
MWRKAKVLYEDLQFLDFFHSLMCVKYFFQWDIIFTIFVQTLPLLLHIAFVCEGQNDHIASTNLASC